MEMHIVEAGGCVAAAAKGFNAQVKGSSLEPLAPFEHHVFQEMSQSLLAWLLEGTPGFAPEIKAGESCFGDGGEDAATAVGQRLIGQFKTVRAADRDPMSQDPRLFR